MDGYALNPGDLSWSGLAELGETVIYDRTAPGQLPERAQGADMLFTNKTVLDEAALASLPGLRYIGVLATGYNVVDVQAAAKRGVVVTNIPGYGTNSVAQHAFALLLELCNRVGLHGEAVNAGEWQRSAEWCFMKSPLTELAGKTMGIVGFGSIGRQVARIASAFGMNAFVPDRGKPLPAEFAAYVRAVPLERLLGEADVISLHCPLTPETQGLIRRETLQLMKPSALLVNTARGALIVEEDLAEALNEGRIGGAALDVLAQEPPKAGSPLIGAKNCIVTPHIAWGTKEARARLMDLAVQNAKAFLQGKPIHVVSPAN
nr:D-2-hydroxyacid dehydrogenase [Paenibacillus hamazuiensis]